MSKTWSQLLRVSALVALHACSSPTAVVGPSDAALPPADVVCATGERACNGQCVNPQTSAQNCGACGMACPAGNVCVSGACTQRR